MKSDVLLSQAARMAVVMGLGQLFSGCVATPQPVQVSAQPVAAQQPSPLSLHVALVLDDTFVTCYWKGEYPSPMVQPEADVAGFMFGEALRQHATDVARSVFREVTIFPDAGKAADHADAILIPRVVKIDEAFVDATKLNGGSRKMALISEWTLMDRSNRRLLWLVTIQAQGEGQLGATRRNYAKNRELFLGQLINDLNEKTLKALEASPEIKRLAASQERAGTRASGEALRH